MPHKIKSTLAVALFILCPCLIADELQDIQTMLQNGQFDEAFPALKQLADAGHPGSQYMICNFYDQGLVVKANQKIAFKYCEAAAAQEHPMAIAHLGTKYFFGSGVLQDRDKGMQLIHQAAELNDTGAIMSLSNLYATGEGVTRDTDKAFNLAIKAANLGSPAGAFGVGNFYLLGLEPGVNPDSPINVGEAMRWLHKSAGMGFIPAFATLGHAYTDPQLGVGDYEEAYFWLSLAHKYGIEDITNLKYDIELKLSKARRNHVNRRIAEWRPSEPSVF